MELRVNIKTIKIFVICASMLADHQVTAAWNFLFATSHGKSPCDGIGGTIKRLVKNEKKIGIQIDILNYQATIKPLLNYQATSP